MKQSQEVSLLRKSLQTWAKYELSGLCPLPLQRLKTDQIAFRRTPLYYKHARVYTIKSRGEVSCCHLPME